VGREARQQLIRKRFERGLLSPRGRGNDLCSHGRAAVVEAKLDKRRF
jgi:hypothetical protein